MEAQPCYVSKNKMSQTLLNMGAVTKAGHRHAPSEASVL
jgi:hypothetical protein